MHKLLYELIICNYNTEYYVIVEVVFCKILSGDTWKTNKATTFENAVNAHTYTYTTI